MKVELSNQQFVRKWEMKSQSGASPDLISARPGRRPLVFLALGHWVFSSCPWHTVASTRQSLVSQKKIAFVLPRKPPVFVGENFHEDAVLWQKFGLKAAHRVRLEDISNKW